MAALLCSDPPSPLREQRAQSLAGGGADAALGDESGDEAGRGYVEGVVGGGTLRRRQADGEAPAVLGPAFDVGDLARVAALDRDRRAALDLPVDRRRGQRDVERDVVVARRQRLQVGADLVRDVAAGRRAVGADNAEIDEALAHQLAAGIVDDDRMRDAVLAELPGGQAGALVARTGLVDPDMDRDALIVGAVDRGERGAPVDGGEPPGIAMRHNLDRPKPPLCSKATAINSVPRAMAVLAVFCSQIT